MAKKKVIDELKVSMFNFLEDKAKALMEDTNIDAVPIKDDNLSDGANIIISIGAIDINAVIKYDYIDEQLTQRLQVMNKDKFCYVLKADKITNFLADLKATLIANPKSSQLVKKLNTQAENVEEVFDVMQISSGQIPFLIIDQSLEFVVKQVGEENGQPKWRLGLTPERIGLIQNTSKKLLQKKPAV